MYGGGCIGNTGVLGFRIEIMRRKPRFWGRRRQNRMVASMMSRSNTAIPAITPPMTAALSRFEVSP